MKLKWLCLTAILLLAITSAVQAMPEGVYFLQDDFNLTFGATGNPLSAGSSLSAWGRLVRWSAEQRVGYFTLNCSTTQGAVNVAGEAKSVTNFDIGTFKITTGSMGAGTVLWSGTVKDFLMIKNDDGSQFDAAQYDRPSYEKNPSSFITVGHGSFNKTEGSWQDSRIDLGWFGTYNWTYDAPVNEATSLDGNLQGKLVPEPSSMIAGLMFLGMFGARLKLRK